MAGIPLPKPFTVAPFVPDTGAPTFADIFDQTMGNIGTPHDGFDQLLSEMTALTDSAANLFAGDDADMQSIADLALGFSDAIEGDFLAGLQPAQDATDRALGEYTALTQPSAPGTTPVGPPTTTPPQPGASDCVKPPAGADLTVEPDMNVGDPPLCIEIDSETYFTGDDPQFRIVLHCGDVTIFFPQTIKKIVGRGIGGGGAYYEYRRTYNLIINPTKPGTFIGSIREYDSATNAGSTDTYYQVTIH